MFRNREIKRTGIDINVRVRGPPRLKISSPSIRGPKNNIREMEAKPKLFDRSTISLGTRESSALY